MRKLKLSRYVIGRRHDESFRFECEVDESFDLMEKTKIAKMGTDQRQALITKIRKYEDQPNFPADFHRLVRKFRIPKNIIVEITDGKRKARGPNKKRSDDPKYQYLLGLRTLKRKQALRIKMGKQREPGEPDRFSYRMQKYVGRYANLPIKDDSWKPHFVKDYVQLLIDTCDREGIPCQTYTDDAGYTVYFFFNNDVSINKISYKRELPHLKIEDTYDTPRRRSRRRSEDVHKRHVAWQNANGNSNFDGRSYQSVHDALVYFKDRHFRHAQQILLKEREQENVAQNSKIINDYQTFRDQTFSNEYAFQYGLTAQLENYNQGMYIRAVLAGDNNRVLVKLELRDSELGSGLKKIRVDFDLNGSNRLTFNTIQDAVAFIVPNVFEKLDIHRAYWEEEKRFNKAIADMAKGDN